MSDVTVAQLLTWLDRDPDRLAKHLARHPADEARLELSTSLDASVTSDLARAVAPEADVVERIRLRIFADPQTSEAVSLVAGLLSLGWETVRFLATGDPATEPRAPRESDR